MLPEAHVIATAVRDAYQALPGAMPVTGVMLDPLQVLAADYRSGQVYRVPVIPGNDATVSFGTPLPGVAAARGAGGVCSGDQQRIAAAVSRGAMPAHRAAYWAACAAAGRSIDIVDQLAGGILAAAGPASKPDDYEHLFGASGTRQPDDNGPEYSALFGTPEEGQRKADQIRAADRAQVAAMTDDQIFQTLFGAPVKPPAAPVMASVPGTKLARRYKVCVPRVNVRVLTASAGSEPAWQNVELRAGDFLPEGTDPQDITRLSHQISKHGPAIKPW